MPLKITSSSNDVAVTHIAASVGDCRWWIMLAKHSPADNFSNANKQGIAAAVVNIRKQTDSHWFICHGPWTVNTESPQRRTYCTHLPVQNYRGKNRGFKLIFKAVFIYKFVHHIKAHRWKLSPLEISLRFVTDSDQTIYCLKIPSNTCLAETYCQSGVKESGDIFQSTQKTKSIK